MQLFDTSQVHAWDDYTIRNEPIASIDLMERAASACYQWLINAGFHDRAFSVFCGKGNNGGDGLAIARMLANSGHDVNVYILEFGHKGTEDFQHNLARLHETLASVAFMPNESTLPLIPSTHVVIDAIFGSGLNRELEGLTAALVHHINLSGNTVVSIDIPTGMFADRSSGSDCIIRAHHTLTFQSYKRSFLFQENQDYLGIIHVLEIGLHPGFFEQHPAKFVLMDYEWVRARIRPRKKFSHKGDYGHGAMITGSKGLMGASVLTAKGFIRSGAGKLTCHLPEAGYVIMQTSVPEAMAMVEKGGDHLTSISVGEKYDVVGIGPGIGLFDSHGQLLQTVFQQFRKPMVIDADALNILSRNKELLQKIPPRSILTPHTREFERLFGQCRNDDERIQRALEEAKELNCIIVLKGPHTLIATPEGNGYFNNTGNPGLAKGGSGDVLTGIITGLLCQGYPSEEAAAIGVYMHGLAGDIAAHKTSMQSLIASDIVTYLGDAFGRFESK